jgi:hypothetical protein
VGTVVPLKEYKKAWFCTARRHRHGFVRVFPYELAEHETHAPVVGWRGAPILLRSFNAQLAAAGEPRWAWCWGCDKWVQAARLTHEELLLAYFSRPVTRREADEQEARLVDLTGKALPVKGRILRP